MKKAQKWKFCEIIGRVWEKSGILNLTSKKAPTVFIATRFNRKKEIE